MEREYGEIGLELKRRGHRTDLFSDLILFLKENAQSLDQIAILHNALWQ